MVHRAVLTRVGTRDEISLQLLGSFGALVIFGATSRANAIVAAAIAFVYASSSTLPELSSGPVTSLIV